MRIWKVQRGKTKGQNEDQMMKNFGPHAQEFGLELGQSKVTEGLKQWNSGNEKKLQSTICETHIGGETERVVQRWLDDLSLNIFLLIPQDILVDLC